MVPDLIRDHRGVHGVEPICKVLPIAPSTYHALVAKRVDPEKCSARAQRDADLMPEIERVFEENFRVSRGFTSEQRKSILRTIISPAQECCADKLGRFLIPPTFRKIAALDREIQFVGTMDKIEIWSMSEWDKVRAQDVKNFPSGTEAAAELGL